MRTELDGRFHAIRLFDTYGGLLTARQRRLMRLYYLRDLSLGEIAERLDITRQAVHDGLRRSLDELERVEQHLRFVRRGVPGKTHTLRRVRASATIARRLHALAGRLRDLADRAGDEDLREIAGDLQALGEEL